MPRHSDNYLFRATKSGERPYEKWVTKAEGERSRVAHERDGWTVTIRHLDDLPEFGPSSK
jgi:hypothetical protein